MSAAEAAKILGVIPRRVQERILDGSLPAERVGHQWTVDEADLAVLRHHVRPGRPMSERSAWAIIAVASGDSRGLERVSPSERSRARARLRALVEAVPRLDLDEANSLLSRALSNRARRATFAASGRDLDDVRSDHRVLLSGLSDPRSNLSAVDVVEGYVAADDLNGVVARYLLSPASRHQANVILHVASPAVSDLVNDEAVRSPLVRAADLAEHLGVREKNEAINALHELGDSGRWQLKSDPRHG